MSYISWHNYGYGICTDDITERSIERLKNLLALAPEFNAQMQKWLADSEIEDPAWDDYMGFDQDCCMELAALLKEVILEVEGLDLLACDSEDGDKYLIYEPSYPWKLSEVERSLTEERLQEMFKRYIGVLTDKPIDITYQEVENGG